jgi:hypothetical protein
MRTVEVLSLGYSEPPISCSQKRWWGIFKPFSKPARYHAANLAAHNWDVLLVDGRVFMFQTKYGGERGHWLNQDGTHEDATAKQHGQLYTPAKRRRRALAKAHHPEEVLK